MIYLLSENGLFLERIYHVHLLFSNKSTHFPDEPGSFIGGVIAQSFDLRAPYLICFLLMILVCLVEEWLIKSRGLVSP